VLLKQRAKTTRTEEEEAKGVVETKVKQTLTMISTVWSPRYVSGVLSARGAYRPAR